MRIKEAKELARDWVVAYARNHEILGAYLNGSVITAADGAELSPYSDVDINLVTDAPAPPDKLGKFPHQGALLEVSFVPLKDLLPPEKLLSTYELAGAFRTDNILYDPSGALHKLLSAVSVSFSAPGPAAARCDRVEEKILRGLKGFSPEKPLLDNLNPWLFPAGICTHLLLAGAQVNPTVRLRYLLLRPILYEAGFRELYEELLGLIGCRDVGRAQAEGYLALLAETFDAACPFSGSTGYPFANDVTPFARCVAVDGSERLIADGDHREAMFWILATLVRCHLILRDQSPPLHEKYLPGFLRVLWELDADTNGKLAKKIAAVRAFLPRGRQAADALYARCLRARGAPENPS